MEEVPFLIPKSSNSAAHGLTEIFRRQIFVSRSIYNDPQSIEPGTMTRTIPGFFSGVPCDNASKMHAY